MLAHVAGAGEEAQAGVSAHLLLEVDTDACARLTLVVDDGALQAVGAGAHAHGVLKDEAQLAHMRPVVGAEVAEGVLIHAGVGAAGGIHGIEVIAGLPGRQEPEIGPGEGQAGVIRKALVHEAARPGGRVGILVQVVA